MTHYDALGARREATPAELRDAYRRAARAAHPDRHGDASSARMAAVNEAWRVLGDPERRRRYDAELDDAERIIRTSPGTRPAAGQATAPAAPPGITYHEPARFPWRFMAGLASVGVLVVVAGVIVYDPPPPAVPDGILRAGDCVDVTAALEAVEVTCGVHDAVVAELIPFDAQCPSNSEGYRDRQGMGIACVVRT